MTEEWNRLVKSGEYARIFASEVPVGARVIGLRDEDAIITGVRRYTTKVGAMERVALSLDDGRVLHYDPCSTVLLRNHAWKIVLDGTVSHHMCETCGIVPEDGEDRMSLCSHLEDEGS